MGKKYQTIMHMIVILCLLVLIVDIIVLISHKRTNPIEKATFDSINEFHVVDDHIIAVGSNNNNDQSYEKAKITLYDKNYEKQWETLYNKKYNSSFFSVVSDKDVYVAVGDCEMNKKEHRDNVRSAIITKYDKNGKLLAERSFQVLGNSKFTKVKVVDDGYIVVGQSIYEEMTLGLSKNGGAFIIKYDKELNEVWRNHYGGSKSGIYNDFVVVGNDIYAVGKDASRVGIISKYDSNGEFISTMNYQYTDTLGFSEIIHVDHALFVVGAKKVKEDQNDYDTDAIVLKYDLDLNLLSEQVYRGQGMERYNGLILDSNSNLVVVGQTGKYDEKKSTETIKEFRYNGILAKYNFDLKELLIEEYDEQEDDYFTDVRQVEDHYIIGGYATYDNSYISKFVRYTKSGKLVGAE